MDERLDFASCFTLPHLLDAADECYRNVRWKRQAQGFMSRRLTNCAQLLDELEGGDWEPAPVKRFTVCERGKDRDVKPVAFRDRVVQRCFCDHVLVPVVTAYVTDDCSAVLPGRGLASGRRANPLCAYDRVRAHAAACPRGGWVGRFDFSSYFATIPHDRLLSILSRRIPDSRLMAFLATVIADDETDRPGIGLELGSHVSQLCATAYPTLLDRAVACSPGVTGYHRHMDDGIVFAADRQSCALAMQTARAMASSLGLTINPRKTCSSPASLPFVFCKMRFSRQADGSVRMNVRKQQSRRACRHAKSVARRSAGHPELDIDIAPVRASLEGYLQRGDADLSGLVKRTLG